MNILAVLPLGLILLASLGAGLFLSRRSFSPSTRTSLNGLSTGILVYLFIRTMAGALSLTDPALKGFSAGMAGAQQGMGLILCLSVGFIAGLTAFVAVGTKEPSPAPLDPKGTSQKTVLLLALYNLAWGFSARSLLVPSNATPPPAFFIGLFLHQALLGFTAGPFTPKSRAASGKAWLLWVPLAGLPFFMGSCIGGPNLPASLPVFVLSLLGGGLLYVLQEHWGPAVHKVPGAALAALVLGLTLAWTTDGTPGTAGSWGTPAPATASPLDADGDRLPFTSLGGPALSPLEIDSQDQASNDILHCRPLQPRVLADGTKQFNLTASSFTWELYNDSRVTAWGYDGQVPGPLIRLQVGDRVQFDVNNQLPQATTVHWHGLAVPNPEDGTPHVTQGAIPPGGRFTYRFTVTPQMVGTHLYHTHFNDSFQMDMGLHGVLIVDPAGRKVGAYGVEALYEMASFKVGGSDQENVFTLNGKAYPEAPVLRVPLGARVLLHLVNASAENDHVMHLHGYTFQVVALDGNPLAHPYSANTINLAPSQTADIAFKADNPGKWMFHCHILDHMINPGPQGEGDARVPANMGGLMTFIEVLAPALAQDAYLAAGGPMDPSCQR